MSQKKKTVKKAVVKKTVKKVVSKKPVAKKVSPLNSKVAVGNLKKLFAKLGKLKADTAKTLEEIAKQEAAISEVLDINVAKFDDKGLTVPPGWETPSVPSAPTVLPPVEMPASSGRSPDVVTITPTSPFLGPTVTLGGASNPLPNAVAYRQC